MEKKEILEKLSHLTVDQLDKLRDRKLVEEQEALEAYNEAKKKYMTKKHEMRRELIVTHSHSKTEQILRADDDLFHMQMLVMELAAVKNRLGHQVEMATSFYWKARA